jgi:hypothetical protein
MSTPAEIVETVMVGALAHAIRMGKRPPAGVWVRGNLARDEWDDKTGAITHGVKHPFQFEVTAELLTKAEALINSQAATFRGREKQTLVRLDGAAELPREFLDALSREEGQP